MKKRTVKVLTGTAIVLVTLGVIYAIWVALSASKLHQAYTALEKAGRPTRAEHVIPPQVSETENAALLYESAVLLLKAQRAPEGNLLEYLDRLLAKFLHKADEPLGAGQLAELRDLLDQDIITRALFAIQLGAERPACRFDLDYGAGTNMLLPHLRNWRTLSEIVGTKTQFEAEAGRSQYSWDLALTQLRFTDGLRNEPLFISQVVRISQIEYACRTIRALCALTPPSQERYGVLDGLLKGLEDVTPLVRAADGERLVFGDPTFKLPVNERQEALAVLTSPDDEPGIVGRLIARAISFKPLLLADHAAYLRVMRESAEMLEHAYSPDKIETLRDIATKTGKYHVLTSMLVPATARVKELHTRMVANIRLARAGLGLLRYRQAHGTWPENLGGLRLEDLDDPFSQGPLLYRPEGEAFILYSVGPDQKDNHGIPGPPDGDAEYDLVWRFRGQAQ